MKKIMAEFLGKRHFNDGGKEYKDYKERFEFKLTVGDNIICQRYFKINNFNERSLCSNELADTLRECADMIDTDLKEKTNVFLDYIAPRFFKNEEQMNKYFENPYHCADMHIGEGIVVGGDTHTRAYVWSKSGKPTILAENFDKGEYNSNLTDDDYLTYKLSFCDNGREVVCSSWVGCYPKAVRNTIDLSNKRYRCESADDVSSMSYDRYVQYKMAEGKQDNVWNIIKMICETCSAPNDFYTTDMKYGNKVYDTTYYMKEYRAQMERIKNN